MNTTTPNRLELARQRTAAMLRAAEATQAYAAAVDRYADAIEQYTAAVIAATKAGVDPALIARAGAEPRLASELARLDDLGGGA
jgi:hypothetical protein